MAGNTKKTTKTIPKNDTKSNKVSKKTAPTKRKTTVKKVAVKIKTRAKKTITSKSTPKKSRPGKTELNETILTPAPQDTNTISNSSTLVLDEQVRISQSLGLKETLAKLLDTNNSIQIDASKIQKIDTSGLQLLTAFSLEARNKSIALEWNSPSESFLKAANLLDLTKHLCLTRKKCPQQSLREKVGMDMPVEPNIFPGHFRVQWSETMHMLDISANQLDVTTQEGNESMELLMDSFGSLTHELDALEKAVANGAAEKEPPGTLLKHCAQTKETINQLVIGLQFYDRFTQRLHNVRESLAVLSALIDDPDKQNVPEEWITLRNSVTSKYSKEQQKTIFHALMQGAEIDEVFEFFDNE